MNLQVFGTISKGTVQRQNDELKAKAIQCKYSVHCGPIYCRTITPDHGMQITHSQLQAKEHHYCF